jgi:hypothetical protein
MARILAIDNHRWPSGAEFPLAGLSVRLSRIAEDQNLALTRWEEDGLGFATGAFCRLPTGRVILLRELDHLVEHFSPQGPEVLIDAGELAAEGVTKIIEEVIEQLGLGRESLSWIQDGDAQIAAQRIIDNWREYLTKRGDLSNNAPEF